jgi:protein arginine N-methyltransferase 1
LRGVLPLFQYHLPSIADARRRFLAPGGRLIPQRDVLKASVVETADQYARITDGWEKNGLDLNLEPARRLATNDFRKGEFEKKQLLAAPQTWATLDYSTIDAADVTGGVRFSIERVGIGHGILLWFDACLIDGIGYSNAPGAPKLVYGALFLPWQEPVQLAEGRKLSVELQARLVEGEYLFNWTTQIESINGSAAIRFQQSQLAGSVVSPTKLRRTASDFVPRPSDDACIHRRVLELMDGNRNLEEIARQLAVEYPARFSRWQQALAYAAKRSQEHSL